MQPTINVQTTTNQHLAPAWVDQVLRDNFFFGEVLGNTEKWDGSQMLFPKLNRSVNPEKKTVSPYFIEVMAKA